MKTYACHKVVKAAEIIAVNGRLTHVTWREENEAGQQGRYDPALFARKAPAVGDYVVVYSDGFMSWSPKAAFEDGYRPVE